MSKLTMGSSPVNTDAARRDKTDNPSDWLDLLGSRFAHDPNFRWRMGCIAGRSSVDFTSNALSVPRCLVRRSCSPQNSTCKLWLHEWLCPEERPEGNRRSNGDASSAPQAAAEAENAESVFPETSASEEGDGMEDVYAIGFQELVDLNAVNVAVDIKSQVSDKIF